MNENTNNTDLIKSINKLKYTTDEKDQITWACEASSNCLKEVAEKLKREKELLKREIARIDNETVETKPQNELRERMHETTKESVKLGYKTKVELRLHNNCLREKVNNREKECKKIIEEYKQHYNFVKKTLEKKTPRYKILKEKQIELKKIKINCLLLVQDIKTRKEINTAKKNIKQKMFYNQIIKFARDWLENEKYEAALKKLKKVSMKERELMDIYLETRNKLKEQEMRAVTKKDFFPLSNFEKELNNQRRNLEAFNKNSQNSYSSVEPPTNSVSISLNNPSIDFVKPQVPKNPFHALQILIDESKNDCPKPGDISIPTKLEFNSIQSKVRIIEDLVIKPPQSVTSTSMSKEERNKIIENKLQKAVNVFKNKLEKMHSQKSKIFDRSMNDSLMSDSQEPLSKLERVPDSSQTNQELDNLNITNQENIQFLSQESRKSQSMPSIQPNQTGQNLAQTFLQPNETFSQSYVQSQPQESSMINTEPYQKSQIVNLTTQVDKSIQLSQIYQPIQFTPQQSFPGAVMPMQRAALKSLQTHQPLNNQTANQSPQIVNQIPQKFQSIPKQAFSGAQISNPIQQIKQQSSQTYQLLNNQMTNQSLNPLTQKSESMQFVQQETFSGAQMSNQITQKPSQTYPEYNNQFNQPQSGNQPFQKPLQPGGTSKNLFQQPQLGNHLPTFQSSQNTFKVGQPLHRQDSTFNNDVNKKLADMKFIAQTTKNVKNQCQFLEPKSVNKANTKPFSMGMSAPQGQLGQAGQPGQAGQLEQSGLFLSMTNSKPQQGFINISGTDNDMGIDEVQAKDSVNPNTPLNYADMSYNFGHVTSFSQNDPNNYDGGFTGFNAFSPTNPENEEPTLNNPIGFGFNFGQSSNAFGFSSGN